MEKGQCEQCFATTDFMIQLRKFSRVTKTHYIYQGWNTEMEINNCNNNLIAILPSFLACLFLFSS